MKYGGHCLRYGHTLVGKNYLLLSRIMEDAAPDNAVRMGSVRETKDPVPPGRSEVLVRCEPNATPGSVQSAALGTGRRGRRTLP